MGFSQKQLGPGVIDLKPSQHGILKTFGKDSLDVGYSNVEHDPMESDIKVNIDEARSLIDSINVNTSEVGANVRVFKDLDDFNNHLS